ncbi:MAG TPA: EAL domain-containing protein [Burkholderiales bacterium]|nr:EAL domain-containing protein [Burkholderiales bacterium]
MPSLVSRFLGRLSVGRKLLLIYLLDLTAVIFVSSILINEKYLAINFARKEVIGNSYILVVRDAMLTAASSELDQPGTVDKLKKQAGAVADIETELGNEGLQSREPNQLFIRSLDKLGERAAALPAPAGAGDPEKAVAASNSRVKNDEGAVAEALTRGHDLMTRIANQSNLILDPDLDSYYTMSIMALRYPELVEAITATAAKAREPTPPDAVRQGEKRTQYLIIEGRLDAVAKGIEADFSEAFAAATPELKEALDPSRAKLAASIERFRHEARDVVENKTTADGLNRLEAERRNALVALGEAWAGSNVQMQRLLELRIHNLFTRMWTHLGTALFLLGVILTMVFFVARAIALPLRRLADVADDVRRTGDHTIRAHWNSTDEIGRLVGAFNDMLTQLDHERMIQQEMAASARAARAQHELLEAIPIPLVVTAVPDHEVLHANQPSQNWLGGSAADPWSQGLEPGVRSRFFQRLADRDGVDEFEVRWKSGTEPVWAVLSARRLNYQGTDAVLTTFTPINRIKLMEQRLELWAKVFEASSESIMIMDPDHRILSVNRAFCRSTLYEFHEVLSETPDFLLSDRHKQTDFFANFWNSVDARGAYQGEIWIRRRNGDVYPAWLVVSVVRDAVGDVSHYIGISLDISDRKESEERIQFLAQHDALTQLPNRSLCLERLSLSMHQSQRTGQKVGVLFIDLDRFKTINDSLGHHVGDGLLRSIAQRLTEATRGGDTVSRLGGDEFVVVLNGVADSVEIASIIERRLIPSINLPHQVEGQQIHISCSVGIAVYPDDGNDIGELMRHADAAMYHAKANGRNMAHFFTPDLNARAQERMVLETSLRYALERGELCLHYQPRVDAKTRRILGVEGLLRWNHPEIGLVSPAHFIPIAEETGLIVPIGDWVVAEACRQYAEWRDAGMGDVCISINLSAVQLRKPGLLETLKTNLARYEVPPHMLELELTETILMDSVETTIEQLVGFKSIGVQLSIDDFGTGYSSLNYLKRFPIDKLKIDRSFVHAMLDDATALAITKVIIGLGHTLGLRVVAEGVEQEDEARALRAAQCDELQGYLFARPIPAAELMAWVHAEGERTVAA